MASNAEASDQVLVLAMACDMPLVDSEAVGWLRDAATAAARGGSIQDGIAAVTSDGTFQPLFAVYSSRLQTQILERQRAGRRSLMGLIEAGSFLSVAAPPEISARLVSVNTPEELERTHA